MAEEGSFGKQRRNLMLISSILALKKFLNLEILNSTILGNSFKIHNIDRIDIALILIWFYFFYRFFNYFFSETNKGLYEFIKTYRYNLYTKALREYKKTKAYCTNYNLDKKEEKFFNHEFIFASGYGLTDDDEYYTKSYNHYESIKIFILVIIFFIFKTRYFSEYYLPIIIATISALYFAFS